MEKFMEKIQLLPPEPSNHEYTQLKNTFKLKFSYHRT